MEQLTNMLEDNEGKRALGWLLTSCPDNSWDRKKMVGGCASGRERIQLEAEKAIFQGGIRLAGENWMASDRRCNAEWKQSSTAIY